MTLSFKIVTPEGVAYEDSVTQVTIPTVAGEITILGNHTPLVSLLRPGEMTVLKGDTRVHFAVDRGVALVRVGSTMTILSDSVARAEDIDLAAAEAARERAQKMLRERENVSDVEFSRVQAMLDRELARLKVGAKYGRK